MEIFELLMQVINPHELIKYGGLVLLIIIIFAETGLFFGFFLPGDSLLFAAGLFCGTSVLDTSILMLLLSLNMAAILGYFTSYWIGDKMGKYFLNKKDTFLFKKKYIHASIKFYKKYGGFSIIVGRFFPIIRTFIPLVAGMSDNNFKRFAFFNVIGSILWVCSLVLSGYFLIKKFPNVQHYLEVIIIGICIVSTVPVIIAFLKNNKSKNIAKPLSN